MTEIFSTLFGQSDAQAPPSSAALGFGPGKPPPPHPQSAAPVPPQLSGQLGDEGPTARKPGVINEPFYLLRELPGKLDVMISCCVKTCCVTVYIIVCVFILSVGNDLTGNTNLITHYNLEHAYNKFCGKKVKEKLSNFLPELPGEMMSNVYRCAVVLLLIYYYSMQKWPI